jgi:hypothetical protein
MRASTFIALSSAIALLVACGGSDDSTGAQGSTPGTGGNNGSTGSPSTSGSSGGGTSSDGGTNPLPRSPSAPGWLYAFSKGGVGVNCNYTEAQYKSANAPSVTFGGTTIYIGFEQIGQNQDPVFARFDNGQKKYCEHHEREPPDGRAVGLAWDGGPKAYVVYSIVGGGSAFDAKGKGQWLDRYGDGGASSKVSFLGEVETAFGTLTKGTFIIAKKKDGKTNTHNAADAPVVRADGRIEFFGDSAFQAMNPDKSIMECTGYPFSTKYVFSPDLKTLECSTSTNCTSKVPCP